MQDEERARYIKDSDSAIELLKFGWKVKNWFEKGGKYMDNGEEAYSEVLVGFFVMVYLAKNMNVNTKKELQTMLGAFRVDDYLRE